MSTAKFANLAPTITARYPALPMSAQLCRFLCLFVLRGFTPNAIPGENERYPALAAGFVHLISIPVRIISLTKGLSFCSSEAGNTIGSKYEPSRIKPSNSFKTVKRSFPS